MCMPSGLLDMKLALSCTLALEDRSCCHVGDDSESICIGGGGGEPPLSDRDDVSMDERRLKSLSFCSSENDVDDRPRNEKSSVRNEFIDVIRPMLPAYVLVRYRDRVGPGSLSTVANEMTDIPLGRSDDDIE